VACSLDGREGVRVNGSVSYRKGWTFETGHAVQYNFLSTLPCEIF